MFKLLPCVMFCSLALCYVLFFCLLSIVITSLGEDRANHCAFRTFFFDLRLFGFVYFLFLLVSGKGCGWFCLFPLSFGIWERLRLVLSIVYSSSFWYLGKAAACDCGTPRISAFLRKSFPKFFIPLSLFENFSSQSCF